ncbi:MAG TPA: alpha/beta fold hydrolase [Thermoleophilaceae bacterium]|nr:alpha/beta fold hydrolase [Thermoleophilaceae bacterium]
MTFTTATNTLASGREQVIHRAGTGSSLLWLHGLFGFDEDDPLVQALTERHDVIAPVCPGFADTTELVDLMDVHDLAQLYDDILVALGLSSVTVVGHSFGAMIGAELAARRQDAVASLVLLSPLGLWDDERPVADLFALPYPDMPSLLYADPSRASGGADTSTLDGDVERLVTLAQALTSVAKFLWPIPDRRLRTRLYRVAAPTLVVFGEKDAWVPASYADDFVAGLPDARSEIVPEAGHMLHLERPEETIPLVTGFVQEHAAARLDAASS